MGGTLEEAFQLWRTDVAMSNVNVLKKFFEDGPDARKLGMDELKTLSAVERAELAAMAAEKLGLKKVASGATGDQWE